MKVRRIISKTIAVFIPAVLLILVLSYSIISNAGRDRLFDSPNDVPRTRVGLLLGTSPRTRRGTASEFFHNRIDAAVDLYSRGRIEYILASGDNGSLSYNEPVYMQKELISRGIPPERIFLDYAGFSTLDSVVRARKVFGQDSLVIISQRFHNERALYIAGTAGLEAYGYNAAAVGGYAGAAVLAREVLARVKAILDIHVFRREPRFLGDPEVIGPESAISEPDESQPAEAEQAE
jgi:SanA protein